MKSNERNKNFYKGEKEMRLSYMHQIMQALIKDSYCMLLSVVAWFGEVNPIYSTQYILKNIYCILEPCDVLRGC